MRVQFYATGMGPKVFVKRLCEYMGEHNDDVQVVDTKPDIYLSAVWEGKPPKGARRIHRADGCYFDILHKGKTGMNKRVGKAISKAYAVVWQSNYCRKLCKSICKVKPKRAIIIYNGIDETIYDGLPVDKMGFDKLFVACAKWRPLKRPRSIAHGFLRAKIPNSGLIMIGEVGRKDQVKHKRIKYIGSVKPNLTKQYYKSADAIIHISRLDACSNTVVEALAAGKPIICNNVGGTPELVKEDGIVLKIDPKFNYKMFKMKNPDSVDPNIIAEGIRRCMSREWKISRPDLSMKHCAQQYYEFFKKCLSE